MLKVDVRERKVIPYLEENYIQIEQLACADYQLWYESQPIFFAERKTWKDLGYSLKDGRIWTFGKFKAASAEQGAIPILILEGRRLGMKRKRGGVHEEQLTKIIHTLMLHHNIHIIKTQNVEDTAKTLKQLRKHFIWGQTLKFGAAGPWTTDETKRMKQALTCIPGVSLMSATTFVEKGLGLKTLLQCPAEIMAEYTYPSGAKFGGKRAEKICAELKDAAIRLRLVSKLPSIGPKSAPALLEQLETHDWELDKIEISRKKYDRIKPYLI